MEKKSPGRPKITSSTKVEKEDVGVVEDINNNSDDNESVVVTPETSNIGDAGSVILKTKTALFMKTGYGYATESGVIFNRQKPYQLLEASEASRLMQDLPERFVEADPEDIKRFYGIEA